MLKQIGHPLLAVATLGWVGLTGTAVAAPGDHIGNDQVQLAPSIGLWSGWRSNLYLQEGEAAGGVATQPGTFLEFRPALSLKVNTADVVLKADFAYKPRLYLSKEVQNLNRFSFFDVGGELNLLPNSVVGLKVKDRFSLSGRETEAESADWAYLTVLTNDLTAALVVRPGSSMDVDLGAKVLTTDFQTDAGTNPSISSGSGALGLATLNQKLQYGPYAALEYKFLPKTAFLLNYSQSWFTWGNNFLYARGDGLQPSESNGFDAYLGIPNGSDFRLSTGLRGRFTDRLLLGVELGYVKMTYDEQSVVDDASDTGGIDVSVDADPGSQGFGKDLDGGLMANLEVGYELARDNRITLGYRRDFVDIYFTNYLAYHQYQLKYDGLIADRLVPALSLAVRQETYEGEVARQDTFLRARGDLTYKAAKFLDVSGGVWWTQRASMDPQQGAYDAANAAIEYDDVNVHLGLTFTY